MNSRLATTIAFLMAAAVTVARAQNYGVDWSSITGGGGSITAGVYTITGTIGQPETGRLNSSDFTIDGGFWSIVAAIQEPGAPLLSVRFTQTNTVVAYNLAGLCAVGKPGLEHHELGSGHYASGGGGDKPDHGGKTGCCTDAYGEAVLSAEESWDLILDGY
jgi:hypothetical protein